MTIKEFFSKYDGKGIDWDNSYGFQCVDLYDQYCVEVVGAPIILVEGAKDIWNSYPVDYFERVLNTVDGVPIEGDVIIWGSGLGTYGHVAIYSEGDVNRFTSFDQNYPVGSKCHFQEHTYGYVIGWLRPKKQSDALTECLKQHTELVTELEIVKKQLTEKDGVISTQAGTLLQKGEELAKATETIKLLEEEVVKKEELRAKWYELYQQCQTNLDVCKRQSATCQKQLTECLVKQDLTWGELLLKIWNKIKGVKV